MRKLAHIEKIEWIRPIEGADRIELAGVLGWQCIVKKSEFQVGDKCVYIEIDSIVDKDNPDFAFLEAKHYKIKTQKMRGVLSQGIIFPLSILPERNYEIGEDVTKTLKITEVEDEMPDETPKQNRVKSPIIRFFMRFKWFRTLVLGKKKAARNFPNWIVKTDETRLQNMPFVLDQYKSKKMILTEKIDGTSGSYGLSKINSRKHEFAICSRNVRQEPINVKHPQMDNVYIEMAVKHNMEKILVDLSERYRASTVVLQGEIVGEGIQKNKYNIKGHKFLGFNLVLDGKKIDSGVAQYILKDYGIEWVPIISENFTLLPTVNEMIEYADGQSVLSPNTPREGLVIRDHKNTVSFKCISNAFLLHYKI